MPLPTEKRPPRVGIGKVWIHGDAGIGKSTTAADMDPDHGITLDTEGSTKALELFAEDVTSWEHFRQLNAELAQDAAKGDDRVFRTVTIDTVDVLAQFCADNALRGLAGLKPGQQAFVHASDFEYGKGWDAVRKEFELRVAQLCAVVPNVVFISHSSTETIKSRTGAERNVAIPALAPKGVRMWLEGFVDHIVYAEVVPTESGTAHLLHTQSSPDYMAKSRTPRGRTPVADPLPMDGRRLRAALEALTAPLAPVEGSGGNGRPQAPAAQAA